MLNRVQQIWAVIMRVFFLIIVKNRISIVCPYLRRVHVIFCAPVVSIARMEITPDRFVRPHSHTEKGFFYRNAPAHGVIWHSTRRFGIKINHECFANSGVRRTLRTVLRLSFIFSRSSGKCDVCNNPLRPSRHLGRFKGELGVVVYATDKWPVCIFPCVSIAPPLPSRKTRLFSSNDFRIYLLLVLFPRELEKRATKQRK